MSILRSLAGCSDSKPGGRESSELEPAACIKDVEPFAWRLSCGLNPAWEGESSDINSLTLQRLGPVAHETRRDRLDPIVATPPATHRIESDLDETRRDARLQRQGRAGQGERSTERTHGRGGDRGRLGLAPPRPGGGGGGFGGEGRGGGEETGGGEEARRRMWWLASAPLYPALDAPSPFSYLSSRRFAFLSFLLVFLPSC